MKLFIVHPNLNFTRLIFPKYKTYFIPLDPPGSSSPSLFTPSILTSPHSCQSCKHSHSLPLSPLRVLQFRLAYFSSLLLTPALITLLHSSPLLTALPLTFISPNPLNFKILLIYPTSFQLSSDSFFFKYPLPILLTPQSSYPSSSSLLPCTRPFSLLHRSPSWSRFTGSG